MKKPAISLVLFGVPAMLTAQAIGEWTAQKDPLGPGWLVSNGDKTVRAKDEKNANKKAKLLNKGAAEVKADPSGECSDPRSGVLC